MKFYDLHIQGKNFQEDQKLLKEAQRLGYSGAAITYSDKSYKKAKGTFKRLEDDFQGFEIVKAVNISAETPRQLKKKVDKFRKTADIIIVEGGNPKINRAACENIRVDILSKPYQNRRDPGINHVHARAAAENNVAIELNTKDIIVSYLKVRTRLFEYYRDIIKLHRKFHFPIVITSSATSTYDLRTPKDTIALFKCINMQEDEIIDALSTIPRSIIEFNRQRDSMIILGAKIIK
ncbi:ribonuclease P protein component 3 [Methanothermobacter tenebrarum]|uniref:Ribonuclease P protein component 3 n=1 Tax=Methanothermobacter tenebrarum TaxID=680118 RepID=A0A328PET3_9EURY|nr:RNase P subunit p30 family protein [Methanothermobacter tenebrarum]MBC7100390.1 ribonuclease P [Methanobacteriales archaeon]MBC7118228.1 ribonuclease P [Methanobacteriaceae archaeon]NPV64351.1 ribonuclease P [Methanobacteriaceae archaeon]RAO79953.1 ribonuclease P [Methanothermobacter tenebrarum]